MFIGSDKSVEDLRRRSDITLNAFVVGFVRLRSTLATHVRLRISSGDIYQGPEKPDKFVCFNFNMKERKKKGIHVDSTCAAGLEPVQLWIFYPFSLTKNT